MVAIVTGNGTGLLRQSGAVLGSRGLLGDASAGRLGSGVTVNASTGNLIIQNQDELLFGKGPDSSLLRTYASLGAGDANGDQWRQSTERTVVLSGGTLNAAGSQLTRTDWDGSAVIYLWDATRSTYVGKDGAGAYDLITYASNVFTWKDGNSRVVETYDSSNGGRITASRDMDGNQLSFTYTGSLLTRVTTASGDYTDLTYSGSNLTQLISRNSSGTILAARTRYGYDTSNRLTSVTVDLTPADNSISDGKVVTYTYTYDGTSKRIASISETGSSNVISFTYDASNRVSTVTESEPNGGDRVTSFAYDTTNKLTTVTDPLNKQSVLACDSVGQLLSITYPADGTGNPSQIVRFAYNGNGDVTSFTDAMGNVTSYSYDSNGNMLSQVDAAGNTVTRTYGSNNELLTETRYLVPDPDGAGAGTASSPVTKRYAYDIENHLRYVVDEDGLVTEYRYNAVGQLTSTLKYPANFYDVSSLGVNAALSETTLNSWVSGITDKSTVQRVDTGYDYRGNISTVTEYSAADTSGNGLTTSLYKLTTYVYDQFGLLLSRQVNGRNADVYIYDGLGRATQVTEATGAITATAFNDAARTVTVTLANGLLKTSVYTAQGELWSYTESASGLTSETENYKYDKLGRLRATADALGGRDFVFYDDAGRKTGYLDRTGALTEYKYDADNRLMASIRYANLVAASAVSGLYDANGNPTTAAIASARPAANANYDRWEWYIYDKADRVVQKIETIDGGLQFPTGKVTAYVYDGTSQVVSTIQYATKLSVSVTNGYKTTLPTTPVTVATSAQDRLVRNFYSKDGLTIGSVDGDGAVKQFFYDKAGRLVKTTSYATLAASNLIAAGTFAQLLTSVGTTSADRSEYLAYDGEGQIRYRLDSNLRPTEYIYDAAGAVIRTIDYGAPIAGTSSYSLGYIAGQITTLNLAANAATRVSRSVYDNAGRKTWDINALGGVVNYKYDSLGNVVKQTRYSATYAPTGDPGDATMVTWAGTNAGANDRIERFIYDGLNRLAYKVDAEGFVTGQQFDLNDRVTASIRYATQYTFSDVNANITWLVANVSATNAATTTYAYDAIGNVIDMWEADGSRTNYKYNAFSQVSDVQEAYGSNEWATVRYRYDTSGKILSKFNGVGTSYQVQNLYTYDGTGNLLSYTDENGNVTTYSYDAAGNRLTETDPLGGITSRQYDAFGNVVKLTDPRGNAGYFYYDTLGRLTLQIDAEGYATETAYNIGDQAISTKRYYQRATGTGSVTTRPTLTADAKDATTSYTRDKLDRLTGTTDAEGFSETYILNAFGDRTSVTNKLGGTTVNLFDKRGLLIQEILPVGSTRSDGTVQAANIVNKFSYDARGNRTQMIEAFGLTEQRTTTYAYDKCDRLISKTGDPITVLNPATMATSSVTPVESYKYWRGNLVQTTDASGARTMTWYDKMDRKIAQLSAVGTLSAWTYDANGNVKTARVYGDAITVPSSITPFSPAPVDANNYRETTFLYDKNNRLLSTTVSGVLVGSYSGTAYSSSLQAITTQNVYDAAGNIVQQIDANNNSVYTWYDKLGRKVAYADQGKSITSWTLDSEGNVLSETRYANNAASVAIGTLPTAAADAVNDRTTIFTYDRNGRRLTETRKNVQASTISGNSVSTSTVDATITYTYNGLGEVTSKQEATGDKITYVYDTAGRQTSVTGQAFTDYAGASVARQLVNSYDGLNNVSRTVQNGTRVTTYSYGAGGRLSTTVDPTGFANGYYYDAVGRLTGTTYSRLKSDGSSIWDGKSNAYDAAGRITAQRSFSIVNSAWVASGDTTEMFYNAYGDTIARGTNSGGVFANAQEFADYDKAGRVWRTNFNDGVTKAYVYDANGNATLLLQTKGTANLRNYADLNAIFADTSGNITQTISVFGLRNKLNDVIQTQSNNDGAATVRPTWQSVTSSGVQTFASDINVVPALNSTGLTAGSSTAPTASSIATARGSVRFSISKIAGSIGILINFNKNILIGEGKLYVSLHDGEGLFSDFTVTDNPDGTTTLWKKTNYDGIKGNFILYQYLVPTGRVILGSANVSQPYVNYDSVPQNAKLHLPGLHSATSAVRMFVRPQGSSGPYQEVNATQLVNSPGYAGGSPLAGWFTYDLTQPPFNSQASTSWDIKYFAMNGGGDILNACQGTLNVNGSGVPSISTYSIPVNGPGQATMTREGGADYLILSGLPTNTGAVRLHYRPVGSNGGWTDQYIGNNGYGQSGFWVLNTTNFGGTYEYWLETDVQPGVRSYGTFAVGSQPSALTQYYNWSETIRFSPPSTAITSQRFRYNSGGGWSGWIDAGTTGVWDYNASGLVDSFGNTTLQVEYEAYNASTRVARTTGNVTLGYYAIQRQSDVRPDQPTKSKVRFTPQSNTNKIILYWRDKGSTGDFSTATVLNAGGFYWDVDGPPQIRPLSGSRTLEYYYDAYDSSDNLLPTQSGSDHVQGNITISSDSYAVTSNQEARWVLDTKNLTNFLIHRAQAFNVFGEIASETDGNGNITTFTYNTEGKLIQKTGPSVGVTGENGVTTSQNLTEYYYYDKSGRQVGQRDANGNLTTASLLAGTGYGGDKATTLVEYRPAGNTTTYGFDVFGNARKVTDALGNVTTNIYDAADRLIEVDHAVRVGGNSPGVQLKDYYAYDGLGQRIKHWNSQLGAGVVETTDYDAVGRVTSTRSFGGQVTTYGYFWYPGVDPQGGNAHISTFGLGDFGGWQKITTNASGLTSYENQDIFGHLSWRQDFGGHSNVYTYDLAGHLVHQWGSTGQSIDYTYYANGYIRSIVDNVLKMKSTFEYDNNGNRTLETYNSTDASPKFYQNAVATYDAANRLTRVLDVKADITYKYDAVGNRRNVRSVYVDLTGTTPPPQDYWYKYDSNNRFVLTMGSLVGGQIVLGVANPNNNAVALTYDAVGNRATATYGWDGHTESYSYTADGYLENLTIAGVVRARRTSDAMGRVTQYTEYDASQVATKSRASTYDNDNRILTETTDTISGGTTQRTVQTYDYKLWNGTAYAGADQGVATHIQADQYTVGQNNHVYTQTNTYYQWWDEAKQTQITINASNPSNPNSGQWAGGFSNFTYDVNGHIAKVADAGSDHNLGTGDDRVLTYTNDAYGQVLVREEKKGSVLGVRQLNYYFDGHRIGDIGNGQSSTQYDYAQALASTGTTMGTGKSLYRYGKPVASVDFDQNYQPINDLYPAQAASLYTAQAGDTLRSIAQSAWGDAALWYLIADANGLAGDVQLVAGQRLILPNKVTNFHNNSSTFKVYNPGEAIGDTLPTLPAQPAPPAPKKHGGCGLIGTILLVVVAVAVTFILRAPVTSMFTNLFAGSAAAGTAAAATAATAGAIAGGVVSAAAGSIVSQGFGVATGLQDKFSWKGVALAGLSGGIVGGLGAAGILGNVAGSSFAGAVVRGAIGSGLTQGVAVATGLQKKFDWAGVAGAGLGAGVGGAIGLGGFGGKLVSGMAGGVASAAAQSLVSGSDFGDTLMGSLPSILGNTIGNALASEIAGSGRGRSNLARSDGNDSAAGGTTGAGDGIAAQPTTGEGRGQLGRGASSVDVNDDNRAAGPDYLNPSERIPKNVSQLDRDEANLESWNNAYRNTHNGQDYADYRKYKDNIAGWRQTLRQSQGEIVITAKPAQSDGGGWYADFGLGILGGFNLHVDRGGVTGSVGMGFFGRVDVGYAFSAKALVELRQENRVFGSLKAGRNGIGFGGEIAEDARSGSLTFDVIKVKADSSEGVSLGTSFDVEGKSFKDEKPSSGTSLSLDNKAVSFGFEGGAGWLHNGRTLSGH